MEELYYIQNRKCVGNCMMFWRVDGNGYTVNLDEAWKVSLGRARDICQSRPDEDFFHPASLIDPLACRHVDVQKVRV